MVKSGVPQSRRERFGIAVMVANKQNPTIKNYILRSEIIITLKLKVGRRYIIIIGIYAIEEEIRGNRRVL